MWFTACKAGPSGLFWWVCIVKGMVFPVVMYRCEKVKVSQLRLTLCDPLDYTVHGILQARILEYWSGYPFSSPEDPNPGMEPRSPTLQANSLPVEPQGKPMDVRVGPQRKLSTEELMLLNCGVGEDS